MAISKELAELLLEQLAPLGAVSVRRMFGGAGVFCDGLMLGLVSDDTLYLKADQASEQRFRDERLEQFTYATKDGRRTLMSYWRAPETVMDDPEEMLAWGRLAFEAALRSSKLSRRPAATKSPRARRTKARD